MPSEITWNAGAPPSSQRSSAPPASDDLAEAIDALWDLVWAGLVTNDSLHPLRAHMRTRRSGPGRGQEPGLSPGHGGPVVPGLPTGRDGQVSPPPSSTRAWGAQLLERHGIVTRSVVASEGIPGGFTALYPVLARLEETGRARRGYFVEGLGGAQFALAGAIDRLREESDPRLVILAATDPANPYGAALSRGRDSPRCAWPGRRDVTWRCGTGNRPPTWTAAG